MIKFGDFVCLFKLLSEFSICVFYLHHFHPLLLYSNSFHALPPTFSLKFMTFYYLIITVTHTNMHSARTHIHTPQIILTSFSFAHVKICKQDISNSFVASDDTRT